MGEDTDMINWAVYRDEELLKVMLEQFNTEPHDQLIEFLMKENGHGKTAFHWALLHHIEDNQCAIIGILMDQFTKQENHLLAKSVMNRNCHDESVLTWANPEIFKFILEKLYEAFPKQEDQIIQHMMYEISSEDATLLRDIVDKNVADTGD